MNKLVDKILTKTDEVKFENLIPVDDMALIIPDRGKDQKGDLYIPEIARHPKQIGKVVSTGPKCPVEKGDIVVFGLTGTRPIAVGKSFFFMVRGQEVLATIDDYDFHE